MSETEAVKIQDSKLQIPDPAGRAAKVPDSKSQMPKGASAALQVISLADLKESKTNPRSGFDAAGLKELAESMKVHGVLQPLTVRPFHGATASTNGEYGQYEIVVGARRFRAAKLAKLESVPAIVRQLTDTEAMEIQIIENLQREDVQPLDEGLGYRALLELWEKNEESQKSKVKSQKSQVEALAEKIGKSASYVYQRLKLADLTKPAQKALAEGKISASHAILIARLQPKDQARALGLADYKDRYPSVQDLAGWIQNEIHHNLAKAPWKKDDDSLLPAAGPCTICPKRAGMTPGLYPDLKPETCTDPGCYQAKMQAHIEAQKKAAERKAAIVVEVGATPKAAAETFALVELSEGYSPETDEQGKRVHPETFALVELSEDYSPETDEQGKRVHPEALGQRKWQEIHAKGKQCESMRRGILVEGARVGQTVDACIDPKCKVHHVQYEDSADTKRYKADRKRADEKRRLATKANETIFQAIRVKVPAILGRADLELVARRMFQRLEQDDQRPLFKLLGWEVIKKKQSYGGALSDYDGTASAKIANLSGWELSAFLLSCALVGGLTVGEYSTPSRGDLLATAKRYGINVAKIQRETMAAMEEKKAGRRKSPILQTNAKKPAIKKVGKTRKPKAQKRGKKR